MANTPAQVALDEKGQTEHPLSFHLDRVNAWLTDLWSAEGLTLHMCDGTVRTGQFGVLRDIREDAAALRRALSVSAEAGDDGQGALVERLRHLAKSWAGPFDEAADHIEALVRKYEIERSLNLPARELQEENDALRADKERLERERSKFIREAGKHFAKSCELADRAEAAERRLAEQGQAQGEGYPSKDEFINSLLGQLSEARRCRLCGSADRCEACEEVNALATPPSPEPDAELACPVCGRGNSALVPCHSKQGGA